MSHDRTIANNETDNKVISRFQNMGLISKNIAELLKNENPQTQHFYLKHKLQKEGILERPFCSSVNYHSSKTSESVDYHLQPMAKKIILRQKNKWLPKKTKTTESTPNDFYLVPLNRKSFYSKIPNANRIKAVKTSVKK